MEYETTSKENRYNLDISIDGHTRQTHVHDIVKFQKQKYIAVPLKNVTIYTQTYLHSPVQKMAEIVNSGHFHDFSFNGIPLFYIHLFKYFTIRNTYIYNKGILYRF